MGYAVIEHVFDPAIATGPVSVKTQLGLIVIGRTNFFEEIDVQGLELSPIQAAKLVLALTKAIETELEYSTALAEYTGKGDGFEGCL